MLAGLYEFDWVEDLTASLPDDFLATLMERKEKLGQKRHVFTHKIWLVDGIRIELPAPDPTANIGTSSDPLITTENSRWVGTDELKTLPFPKVLTQWRDDLVVALTQV